MKYTRVGIGYDVHRLTKVENGYIPVCGVRIPCNFKTEAHSDGDVGLHALTEAMLGAIANGNIGSHFPNTDPQWKGVESKIFVAHAAALLQNVQGEFINADITIVCEKPKIMPHSLQMRQVIAEILSVHHDQISVKATTTEKMGYLGRTEGIAAHAVCSILVPYRRKDEQNAR